MKKASPLHCKGGTCPAQSFRSPSALHSITSAKEKAASGPSKFGTGHFFLIAHVFEGISFASELR
jgi:hypothetical protein